MRFIPWNEEVADKTYKHYKKVAEGLPFDTRNKVWCWVAENLVRVYYGLEPKYLTEPDPGYDMILDNNLIDIKACNRDVCQFDTVSSRWSVKYKCIAEKNADYLLFVQIDKNNKKVALIGQLTPIEVSQRCKYVKKGDPIYCGYTADVDQFLVEYKDIKLIY